MSHQTPTTLTDIEQIAAQVPSLGATVFWRLTGVCVSHDDLVVSLKAASFEQFKPAPPSYRKAMRRALEEWIKARLALNGHNSGVLDPDEESSDEDEETGDAATATNKKRRTLIRVMNRPGGTHIVFALVAEDLDFAALGLSYGTQIRILLHKATGSIVCTTDAVGQIDVMNESQWLANELRPYWEKYQQMHISGDLSRMVREIVASLQAVSLRKEGGLYFVPLTHRPELERLRHLVAHLPTQNGGQPFVCALPVPDLASPKKQMARAAHAGFLDELGSLRMDLKRFVEGDPAKIRPKTVAERLVQYKRIRAKAQTYADLLDMQRGDIDGQIAMLEEQANALLGVTLAEETATTPTASAPVPSSTDIMREVAPADAWDIGE